MIAEAIVVASVGETIGNILVKVLAVAGAWVIGYFATLALLWIVSKLAFNKRLPKQVTRLLCVVGGVAAALLVGWLLFVATGGGGGWGFGPGFGFGTGKGSGTSGDERPATSGSESTKPPRSTPEGATEPGAAPPLRILMLGGDRVKKIGDKEFAFYRIQPDGPELAFDGIRTAIRDRAKSIPPLKGIVIIIEDDSVAQNHPAVKRLEELAKDERLAVTHQLPAKP